MNLEDPIASGSAGAEGQAPVPAPRRELTQAESLGTALALQAEVLRRLHEEQRRLGEAVRDNSRSELMLRSAQSLNDSFTAMRHSQEQLAAALAEARRPRARWLWVTLALVAVAALFFGLRELGNSMNDGIDQVLQTDAERESALKRLEDRLQGVEGREREILLDEVRSLRAGFAQQAQERADLTRERDAARAEVSDFNEKDKAAVVREEQLQQRLKLAEQELARLTEKALADQRLLAELNSALETARAALPEPVSPLTEKTPKPVGVGENARSADATLIADVNALLARHSGYEKHVLRTVNGVDSTGLLGVVMEVRGRDDKLSRVVEAERLKISLTARTRLIELEFVKGTVTFHQGVARPVRSPFFNERYEIVLVGVETAAWTSASLPFSVVSAQ